MKWEDGKIHRTVRAAIAVIALLWSSADIGFATEDDENHGLRHDIEPLWRSAAVLASALEDELFKALPTVGGWTCRRDEARSGPQGSPSDALVFLALECSQPEQSLRAVIAFDRHAAQVFCKDVLASVHRVTAGIDTPKSFRFFDTGSSKLKRIGSRLNGCLDNEVTVMADGDLDEAAIANDFAAIDAFAGGLVDMRLDDIMATKTYQDHQDIMVQLTAQLDAQSNRLANMIPHPKNIKPKSIGAILLNRTDGQKLPYFMFLGGAPSASVTLDFQNCNVVVSLSAALQTISEKQQRVPKWGRRSVDGDIKHAFRRIDTERFVGQETVTGNQISVLVDDQVFVDISILGNKTCENEPDIVHRVFQQVVQHNMSDFGVR